MLAILEDRKPAYLVTLLKQQQQSLTYLDENVESKHI